MDLNEESLADLHPSAQVRDQPPKTDTPLNGRKRKPRPPSVAEARATRINLAKSGEPWALYDAIQAEDHFNLNWDEEFAGLLAALEKRAQEQPALFTQELLQRILASGAYLWLRTQFYVEHQVRKVDEVNRRQSGAYLPTHVIESLIPRLVELGRYVSEVALIQAKTLRQQALARSKQAETAGAKRQSCFTQERPGRNGELQLGRGNPASFSRNGEFKP